MQLFCLTFAGGTAAFYNQIEPYLDTGIEVIKLEYAGHGTRHKESFYKDFNELSNDIYGKILELVNENGEYALFGYSMGSISAVEILKIIIERNEIKLPVHVFIAAHEPIANDKLVNFSEAELDEYVRERTIKFGGIPEKLINNYSFWRMYLPIYRSDYSIIGKYNFSKLGLKTIIPAVVFYSPTDTKPDDMRLWGRYFVGNLDFFEYSGSHFFINEHCEEICSIINQRLLKEENIE